MKLSQITLQAGEDPAKLSQALSQTFDMGIVFAAPDAFKNPTFARTFANASGPVVGCSTAGEISSSGVSEQAMVLTTIQFEKGSRVRAVAARLPAGTDADTEKSGTSVGNQLNSPGLKLVFVLGVGVNINGSALIRGISKAIPKTVQITGGLAADYGAFKETFTLFQGEVSNRQAVAIGFYGDNLEVGYGSEGGWKPFGPARRVTRAEGNILFELDGESALGVYETYLGDKAAELPAAGLLYPFALVQGESESHGLIRTILGIDKAAGSLILAGDIPADGLVRLMHAGTDNLVDGAERAAGTAVADLDGGDPGLALLVSCVGRKLVMGQDTEEEIDAVKSALPGQSMVAGFYSNGEIAPFAKGESALLHNQTMTITFLRET